jgi:hypothetical protein
MFVEGKFYLFGLPKTLTLLNVNDIWGFEINRTDLKNLENSGA